MARERMVTRTIECTLVEFLAVDIVTTNTRKDYTYVTGNVAPEKMLEAVKRLEETDTCKVVAILSQERHDRLYGMKEQDFFSLAIELDPETRKPLNS